ncbi:ankyrin repeat-containing domain protein [Pyronema domesticum]|nr:ankyrin repeat-containing domain protein [Pyronema domesticum]
MRYLIEKGADINCVVLSEAIMAGYEEVFWFLIKMGADINAPSTKHGTALQAAARNNNIAIVRFLLDSGADVNIPGGKHGGALQSAVYSGNQAMVEVMIKYGANTEGCLEFALSNWVEIPDDIVRLLLKKGIDINARGKIYGSVLQMAAHNKSFEFVRFLVDNGADVNNYGGEYGSALKAVAYRKLKDGRRDIFLFLLDRVADINPPNCKYFGGVVQGVAYWHKDEGPNDLIRLLLEKGADLNANPRLIETIASTRDTEMFRYLLANSDRITDEDSEAKDFARIEERGERIKKLYYERRKRRRITADANTGA